MTRAKAGETSSVKRPSGPNRKRYTDDFKRSAVRLVTDEKYSFKAAAKAVQISEKSLRDWHALLAPKPAPCGDDANLQELREENRMCEVLQVSKSGYYESRQRSKSQRTERHERIQEAVREVHAASHGIFGSHKIARELQRRDDLESACRNTVANAMKEMGLASRVRKAFRPTTTQVDPAKQPADNLLRQDFMADAPNRKWVTDITYLRTATGWIYLAVVLDLFSRKVVGWALSDSLATEVVQAALRMAIQTRSPLHGELLLHSDRGCQFTSDAFQMKLKLLGIACSMSRTGCCYGNAVMERFFWSLKHEWTNHQTFETIDDARLSVFKYIETFYNPVRIHQTLEYRSPNQFEADHAPVQAA